MASAAVETPLSIRERYAGLLYGAFVADSLALGAHWIYDQAEISGRFGRMTDLRAAVPGSYHSGKSLGAQTHYGDQSLVLLESLEACGGNFVMDDFARRWREFWNESKAYRDHATKETLAHLEEGQGLTTAGSDSTELGGAARIAPLLAAMRDEDPPTIIAATRAQTALTHADPLAIDGADFITRTVFLLMRGVTIPSALEMATALPYKQLPALDFLKKAIAVQGLETSEAVEKLGASCSLDKALPSVFAILLKHGANLETALIENVMAGGDSAARGMVLGLLLGAACGRRAIPLRWIDALQAKTQLDGFSKTIRI